MSIVNRTGRPTPAALRLKLQSAVQSGNRIDNLSAPLGPSQSESFIRGARITIVRNILQTPLAPHTQRVWRREVLHDLLLERLEIVRRAGARPPPHSPIAFANRICQSHLPVALANRICQSHLPIAFANRICQSHLPIAVASRIYPAGSPIAFTNRIRQSQLPVVLIFPRPPGTRRATSGG